MKKLATLALAAALGLGLSVSTASADAVKGQKLYLKFMKAPTGMNGGEFAAQHTQAQWQALCENNGAGFIEEYSAKFPDLEKFLKGNFSRFQPDICDFVINFASDSGNVPSC